MRALLTLKLAILTAAILVGGQAFAESVRAHSYSEVRERLLAMELVIFDLDSTLVRSERMFGSDGWFDREVEANLRRDLTRTQARKEAEALSDRIQSTIRYELIEPSIATLIHDLQAKGVTVMILTARREPQKIGALRALRETGLDFRKTAPELREAGGLLYVNGVLFANGEKKGPVLDRFLRAAGLAPRSIAFVDDKLYNLNSLLPVLREVAPEFLVIHYTGADEYNARFSRDVSEYQKSEFLAGRAIPGDVDALLMVRAGGLCRTVFN